MSWGWHLTIKLLSDDHQVRDTCTISGPRLVKKFFEVLSTLLPNMKAVDAILAHENTALLWSRLEQFECKQVTILMQIVEVEPNTFTLAHVACHCPDEDCSDEKIEPMSQNDFKSKNHEPAVVFDVSDNASTATFRNDNFVTTFNSSCFWEFGLMGHLVMGNKMAVLCTHLHRNERFCMEERINSEPTPFQLACMQGNEEIVAMFVYYNVSPDLPPVCQEGNTYYRHPPIYYATNKKIVNLLIDYTYDRWSDFDVDFLLKLMLTEGEDNLERVVSMLCDHARTMSFFASKSCCRQFWLKLFNTVQRDEDVEYDEYHEHVEHDEHEVRRFPSSDVSYLQRGLAFLLSHRTTSDLLVDGFRLGHWNLYWRGRGMWHESERKLFFRYLYCLGDAVCEHSDDEPKPTILHRMLDKLEVPLRIVTGCCLSMKLALAEAEPMILMLLANNAPLDSHSFDNIFRYCHDRRDFSLWHAVRHMEVVCPSTLPQHVYYNFKGHLASSYYHRFRPGLTIMDVLRNPAYIFEADMIYYARMSSHPAIKNRIADTEDPVMLEMLNGLPEFSPLLEYARDAARNYVIDKYKVETGLQFHLAVSKLQIPEYLKKIVEYDLRTPLYNHRY